VQDVGDDRRLGCPRPCPVRAEHRARSPARQQRKHVGAGHLALRVRQVRPPHAVSSLEPEQHVDPRGRAVEVDQDGRRPSSEVAGNGRGEGRRPRPAASGDDTDDERTLRG
jgi:hypothetical protein